MPGRHRKQNKQTTSWQLPTAVAATLAAGMFVVVGAVGNPEQPAEPIAHLAAPPVTSSSQVPRTSTTTPPAPQPPATSSQPPATSPQPPATTAAPPVTTTASKTTAATRAPSCRTTLAGVKPHVAQVGNHIAAKFDVANIGGVAGRSGASDHPLGLALDFMVDTATGNALAEYVLANRQAFGVSYVIWRQRYNDGDGWSAMEDRGSATANHLDHVHVSFHATATVKVTC
jgi:cytoskeletal protein RodZ